jgi:hypothetical protein
VWRWRIVPALDHTVIDGPVPVAELLYPAGFPEDDRDHVATDTVASACGRARPGAAAAIGAGSSDAGSSFAGGAIGSDEQIFGAN